MTYDRDSPDGPTAAELAAIEDEWPVHEAEIALLDVQIEISNRRGAVDEVTVRRLRQARAAVVAESLRWYQRRFNVSHRAA